MACGILAAGIVTTGAPRAQSPVQPAPASPQPVVQPTADTRLPCIKTMVAMLDTIDSARAKPGDGFTFALVDAVTAPGGAQIPSGTVGYGVVANASHADRGGRGGYLALETRFVELADGKHVPILIDRANDNAAAALGASGNAPGVLGLIPIVGYAVGGYDSLHHGKDATIPRGTRVGVFVGDDAARGACRPPAAGETPAPATR